MRLGWRQDPAAVIGQKPSVGAPRPRVGWERADGFGRGLDKHGALAITLRHHFFPLRAAETALFFYLLTGSFPLGLGGAQGATAAARAASASRRSRAARFSAN